MHPGGLLDLIPDWVPLFLDFVTIVTARLEFGIPIDPRWWNILSLL